ncbi:MAG: patatin-like phospholipase/acyl hydrolase, partial [Salibacteraceae bacterium]
MVSSSEEKNKFKILSIDGGGVKGLYSATILKEFEQTLRSEKGDDKRIVDYFDLICGTSTGGLIALALSLRIPTETICAFYEIHGPKIFRYSDGLIPLLRQTLFRGKYSDKKMKIALKEIFNEKKIGESECLLCIPTYDFTQGTYEIFKFDHPEGRLKRDNVLSAIDVALATSAAPTYFPIAEVELHNHKQYVDGGVWANNPSVIGFTEAIRHFVGNDKE